MLAYIPYMDPMGKCKDIFKRTSARICPRTMLWIYGIRWDPMGLLPVTFPSRASRIPTPFRRQDCLWCGGAAREQEEHAGGLPGNQLLSSQSWRFWECAVTQCSQAVNVEILDLAGTHDGWSVKGEKPIFDFVWIDDCENQPRIHLGELYRFQWWAWSLANVMWCSRATSLDIWAVELLQKNINLQTSQLLRFTASYPLVKKKLITILENHNFQ